MKRISLCSVALLGSVWLLTGCSKEAAEKKRIETEVRIIQCEAGRWGGADDFLTRLFLDRAQESAMRRRAAMAMGRIGQPAFIPSLRQTLNDADAELRATTLLAIGEILDAENTALYGTVPDPEVIDAIHRCLTDPAAIVRARAVEALGKTGRQEFMPAPEAIAPNPDQLEEETRQFYAREWIKATARVEQAAAVPAMIRLLASPVGGTAARMLARLARRRSLTLELPAERLTAMLRNPDPLLRAGGLDLAPFVQPSPNAAALAALLADPDHGVRLHALGALGRLKTAAAAAAIISHGESILTRPELKGRVRDAYLWKELEAAVNALGQAGDPAGRTAVRRWMEVDGFLAARGFQALVAGDPATPMPVLSDVAPLGNQSAASHWIQAAAASQDPAALAWLRELELGQRPDGWRGDWVTGARSFYVARLLDAAPDAPGETLRLLADSDPFVQAAALDWLHEKVPALDEKQAEAVRALVAKRLTGDAADPLISAVPLLSRAGEQGRGLLNQLLKSKFYPVRMRAALALKQLGDPDPFARIVPMPTAPADFYRNFLKRGRYGCQVEIRTNKGSFFLELFRNDAPLTCMNFLSLAGERYYNGIAIHRVVPDFVVQAGCPLGTGNGGPGYAIPCEISSLVYDRGMVGMALSGRDTGGSQFFVTLSPQPHLDGGYTIFARISGGMDVVDNLIEGDRIEGIEIFWDIPWEEKRPLKI